MTTPSKTFCCLPWMHVSTQPDGPVVLCCESDMKKGINRARNGSFDVNLHTDSIDDAVNSGSFKKVRLQMLAGEIPEACKPCFEKEAVGIKSKRIRENKKWDWMSHMLEANTDEDGGLRSGVDLKFLELRLGNTCNVRCRTCNPNSSSNWLLDYKKMGEVHRLEGAIYQPIYSSVREFTWPKRQEFWDEVFANAGAIEELYINGGEPTLSKEHWDFLEKLADHQYAENIKIWYSCNMTRMPEDRIQVWKEFQNVRVEASIDDLYERNGYIRHPTLWSAVVESANVLTENEIDWGIIQTISIMNIFYLPRMLDWAQDKGVRVSHNYVYEPYYFSPRAMPRQLRQYLKETLPPQIPKHQHADLLGVLDDSHPEAWDDFLTATRNMDQVRGQYFQKTFRDFCDLLDRLEIEKP